MLLSFKLLLPFIIINKTYGIVRTTDKEKEHVFAGQERIAAGDICSEKKKYSGEKVFRFVRGDGKPNRRYYIYTPKKYLETDKTKVILAFHGWGETGKYYTHPEKKGGYKENTKKILKLADKYNYAIVAFDGLTGLWGEGHSNADYAETQRSWTSLGTASGLTADNEATCEIGKSKIDYCYYSQCDCTNRCGYSHCADDDIQMIADFINTGELAKNLCYDSNAIFAMGNSNGGIFTWNLAQDDRTAALLKGIAPIIAAPVCGYNKKSKEPVPVISMVGTNDPTHPVHTWKGGDECVTSSRGEGAFKFVTSHKITTTFADGQPGCKVTDTNKIAWRKHKFDGLNALTCRTWCQGKDGKAPFSLNCYYKAKHEDMPKKQDFTYEAAMRFFNSHLGIDNTDYYGDDYDYYY